MTNKQKIEFGKIYNKFNAQIERYALKFFYQTLKKQSKGLKEVIDTYPIESVPFRLDGIIENKTFEDAFDEFYGKVGKTFLAFYEKYQDFHKKKDRDLSGATEALSIAFRDAAKIAELAKVSKSPEVGGKVTKITTYTRKLIVETIQKGIEDNKTKPQIAREIASKTSGQIAKQRALTIARTETTFIASKAAEININQSPFKMQKEWIPVSDNRTRPDHLSMMGHKPIGKDELFNVGGVQMKYPGDPSGGAANCCNCRCAIFYSPIIEEGNTVSQNSSVGSLISNAVIADLLSELLT